MSSHFYVLPKFQNIVDGDMSLASITSAVTNIENLVDIAISLVFTGSPTGTFAVQGSVDHVQDSQGNVTTPGTWTAITLNPAAVASGSAGNILINLNQLAFPWIRVVYTKDSGTGTLEGYIAGKGR